MIDLHSHILPGLDDGAQDLEESLEMARMAVLDGISGIVCTPHMSPSFPGNDREVILAAVEALRAKFMEEGIGVELYPGCELAIDSDLPEKVQAGKLLTLNDRGNIVLIEMPPEIIPPHMSKFFWMMQVRGLSPILAHPERNYQLIRHPSTLLKWVEAGVLIQITGGSLKGHYGGRVRDFSLMLLKRRMVHFVGTDSHSPNMRRPVLSEVRGIVESIVGVQEARMIFDQHPAEVLDGKVPDVTPAVCAEKKKDSLMRRIFPFWQ
ncbi:MAG TPA: CpsB/CapC family capsule biosynthesis tyrosine phosphatase [Syntrophobacteraceae bacterium]|nr:CpsB/CapC family capsule biosynthesis tyrosine phosphatase [Syntrophobacteraceae bacterium]